MLIKILDALYRSVMLAMLRLACAIVPAPRTVSPMIEPTLGPIREASAQSKPVHYNSQLEALRQAHVRKMYRR